MQVARGPHDVHAGGGKDNGELTEATQNKEASGVDTLLATKIPNNLSERLRFGSTASQMSHNMACAALKRWSSDENNSATRTPGSPCHSGRPRRRKSTQGNPARRR